MHKDSLDLIIKIIDQLTGSRSSAKHLKLTSEFIAEFDKLNPDNQFTINQKNSIILTLTERKEKFTQIGKESVSLKGSSDEFLNLKRSKRKRKSKSKEKEKITIKETIEKPVKIKKYVYPFFQEKLLFQTNCECCGDVMEKNGVGWIFKGPEDKIYKTWCIAVRCYPKEFREKMLENPIFLKWKMVK